ncbi:MAG: hypothetical protein IJW55_04805 [Clostridia bacterium]|nr:hypothetical protein [Clostridia bacterium]
MFCKYCGQEVEENSRFCSGCGKVLTELEEQETTITDEISNEEKTNATTNVSESFFKLSRTYYCSNCGTNIGKSKTCPKCHHKKSNVVNNFCKFCGAAVEDEKCSNSNVLLKAPLIEKLLRIVSIFLIWFSLIGVLIHIVSGGIISAVILLSIAVFLSLFVVSDKQIYKLKGLLTKKNIKQIWICIVYILVIIAIILGINLSALADNSLSRDDLAAYELISEVSYDFKNPSSVRIVSGSVCYDEDEGEYSGWFALSATNGYGARTVGYYFVGYLDGDIFALDLEENASSTSIRYAKIRDELDVDKINKALDKKWGTSYND